MVLVTLSRISAAGKNAQPNLSRFSAEGPRAQPAEASAGLALRGGGPGAPGGCCLRFKSAAAWDLEALCQFGPEPEPPGQQKLVNLAEFPWRRECQLGESEGNSDETYISRRECDRRAICARFRRLPMASFGQGTVNWRSEWPNQGFRFCNGQFATSEKQSQMLHT